MLLSIITKVFAGTLVGGLLGWFVTGDWIFVIVWTISLTLFLLCAIVGGTHRRVAQSIARDSVARIESVSRTGRENNGLQELSVRLTVAPERERAYQTSTMASAPTDGLRQYSAGAIVAVSRAGLDRPDVRILPVVPPELTARVAAARADASIIPPASSAPAWETATTTTPGTRKPGSVALGKGLQALLSLLIIIVVAAVTMIPAWGSIARAAQSYAVGDWDGPSLISGNYQQEAVDAVADVVGGYEFTRVGFYETYLIVDAPTTPGADTTDTFTYRYGRAWREGPEFIQPTDVDAVRFDASGLDFGQVAAAVELTKQASDLTNPSYHAWVARDAEHGPIITVSVSGDYGSMTYMYGFDLELLNSF